MLKECQMVHIKAKTRSKGITYISMEVHEGYHEVMNIDRVALYYDSIP